MAAARYTRTDRTLAETFPIVQWTAAPCGAYDVALPVTITGAAFPNQNYFCGPFKAPNQQIYLVLLETTGGTAEVYMATDPTASFAAQDTSNNPTQDPITMWAYLSGSEIHLVTITNNFPEIKYHVFDTASDTWTTTNEAVDDVKNYTDANLAASVAVRSDGDVILLYTADPDADMGNDFARVDYARREASSWTIGVDVGGTSPANINRVGGILVRGSVDNMHFFWTFAGTNELQARSLDSANSLGATRVLDQSTNVGTTHKWTAGISWNDAGTWRIIVPVEDLVTSELLVIRWVESSGVLAASPGETIVGSPEDVAAQNGTTIACAAIDGDGRMYLMWSGGGAAGVDLDLYRDDAAPPYTSWSGETEVIDATTINRISCNVYPRDGAIKLAFVYDEAGTIKYNEISIAAPTAPAMAASRFPDQNYKIGPFSV